MLDHAVQPRLLIDECPFDLGGDEEATAMRGAHLDLVRAPDLAPQLRSQGWRPAAQLVHYARDVQSGAFERWLGRRPNWKSRARMGTAPVRLVFRAGLEALSQAAHLELEVVTRFDDRVDGLWQSARHDYRVIAERSGEALAHRFDEGQDVLHRVYMACHKELVGYFVLRTHLRNGIFVSELVDFLSRDTWLLPLFVQCLLYAHETHSAALVLSASGPHLGGYLTGLGFDPRHRDHILVRTPRGQGSAMTLPRAEQWFLTGVDRPRACLKRVLGDTAAWS